MFAAAPKGYLTLFSSTFIIIDAVDYSWQGWNIDLVHGYLLDLCHPKDIDGWQGNSMYNPSIKSAGKSKYRMTMRNSNGKGTDNGTSPGSDESHDG